MLLIDIKKVEGINTPIYSISIDGAFVRRSFTKIANDISELKFNQGLIEE